VVDGLVVADKPAGWTSHDVVARCRRLFGQRRVGHAGTLDPPATGVLLVGLGRVTRLLRFLTVLPKRYRGEVALGVATNTLDDTGVVTGEWDMSQVTVEEVRAAAARLTGPILQVPPMVSALKVAGRRLHQLAREGNEVARQARPVVVHSLMVEPTAEQGVFTIDITCSSGTYVRSLASDLGAALGGGAHLRGLRRLAIGSFTEGEARTLEELARSPHDAVLPPIAALRDLPRLVLTADLATAAASGGSLPHDLAAGDGPWAVVGPGGDLLAVYERRGTQLRPAVVLWPGCQPPAP